MSAKTAPKSKKKAALLSSPKYLRHVKTAKSFTLVYEDSSGAEKSSVIPSSSALFTEIVSHLQNGGKKEDLVSFLPSEQVSAASNGRITSKNGEYMLNGHPITRDVYSVLQARVDAGLSTLPFERFHEKLLKNPSQRSREQFFGFVVKHQITLLADGRTVFYKRVREDMKSHHDGKTLHEVGKELVMDRKKVCDDSSACAAGGFHASSWEVLDSHFRSGKILELYIDPEHIVSVPNCNTKLRCCRYFINRVVKDPSTVRTGLFAEMDLKKEGKPKTEETRTARKELITAQRAVKKEAKKQITKKPSPDVLRLIADSKGLVLPASFLREKGFLAKTFFYLGVGARAIVLSLKELKAYKDSKQYPVTSKGVATVRRSDLLLAGFKGNRFRVKNVSKGQIEIEAV